MSPSLNNPLPREAAIFTTQRDVPIHAVATPINATSVAATTQPHTATTDDFHTNFNPLPNGICTPVNVNRLYEFLVFHPDQTLVNYIINGFIYGFDIGYSGPITEGQSKNLLSARNNPDAVHTAINKELVRKHTSGPFNAPPFSTLHCSPLGAVPKKDNSYRIILDLSSPRGHSINEGIPRDQFSVRYSSFDDAVKLVSSLGQNAYLAKLDIQHAFRLCPVRQEDWCLLGHSFDHQFFVDTRLPFGSRSSHFIFNKFADLLLWILVYIFNIATVLHYLDDFFICASNFEQCEQYMNAAQCAFDELGIPLAPEKIEGPSQCLTYLGIEIDACKQTIRLPPVKYKELVQTLKTWTNRKKCTKRELLSLIGSLSFACKVVKPGRIFLRRLIDLSTTVTSLNYHIYLNSEARADINWWHTFLPSWNGVIFFQEDPVSANSLSLFTDASSLGFGANSWFSSAWPYQEPLPLINFLELFAVVAAIFSWGKHLVNKAIIIYTDLKSIAHVWKSGTCRDKGIMRLVRALFMFAARHNINILMEHLPGHQNYLADSLSRLQVNKFQQLCPHADAVQSTISTEIWKLC